MPFPQLPSAKSFFGAIGDMIDTFVKIMLGAAFVFILITAYLYSGERGKIRRNQERASKIQQMKDKITQLEKAMEPVE